MEAATLHTQTLLEDAAASVTVISAEEIRTYGWRTLGEALASVRGFYVTNDRTFDYVGIRGFSLPGDYTTRLLVMLNGHYLTDNVYSSNGCFGQDFALDMDLVQRIEIVRSTIPGNRFIFRAWDGPEMTMASAAITPLRAWCGETGRLRVWWARERNRCRPASLVRCLETRATTSPVLAGFSKRITPGTSPRAAGCAGGFYYDQERYRDRYDYALDSGIEHTRDRTNGDWVGSQLAYDLAIPHVGVLMAGGEVNADIRAEMQFYEQSPQQVMFLNVDHPDFSYGIFAQQQWQIASNWTAYLGVRFDDTRLHSDFVSPRAALVYRDSKRTSYKLLYGRAFRNPNAFESYYADGITQIGNPLLRPERAQTFEFDVEHKFGENWTGVANAYYYALNNLIEAVSVAGGLAQYQNATGGRAEGISGELAGKPARWLETTASLAWMRPKMDNQPWLVNSPSYTGKWRAAVPVARQKLWAAAMQYLSTRRSVVGDLVPSVCVTDLTFTTRKLHPDFDIQFGVRNALNRVYYDPAGVDLPEQRIDV